MVDKSDAEVGEANSKRLTLAGTSVLDAVPVIDTTVTISAAMAPLPFLDTVG